MSKDFRTWGTLKERIHKHDRAPMYKQREIWWCNIGANIGHETDGKSKHFSRPVLVIRKFNRYMFLGVPLTTQIKDNPFYHKIHLHQEEQCIMLSQLKLWDSKRLQNRIGSLPKEQFEIIRVKLRELI